MTPNEKMQSINLKKSERKGHKLAQGTNISSRRNATDAETIRSTMKGSNMFKRIYIFYWCCS